MLGIIDYTRTAVGSRLLKNWLEKPLLSRQEIQRRLDSTEELVQDTTLRLSLKEYLDPVYDLERIVSRIAYGTANAKDLLALKNSLAQLPALLKKFRSVKLLIFSGLLKNLTL